MRRPGEFRHRQAEWVEVAATRDGSTLQLKVRFRAAKDAGRAATTEEVQKSFDE